MTGCGTLYCQYILLLWWKRIFWRCFIATLPTLCKQKKVNNIYSVHSTPYNQSIQDLLQPIMATLLIHTILYILHKNSEMLVWQNFLRWQFAEPELPKVGAAPNRTRQKRSGYATLPVISCDQMLVLNYILFT